MFSNMMTIYDGDGDVMASCMFLGIIVMSLQLLSILHYMDDYIQNMMALYSIHFVDYRLQRRVGVMMEIECDGDYGNISDGGMVMMGGNGDGGVNQGW